MRPSASVSHAGRFGYTAEPGSASEDALKLLGSWAASAPDSGIAAPRITPLGSE
jgi:hypothetical protein